MLNIARIGPGGEDYYLARVVSAVDYYVERRSTSRLLAAHQARKATGSDLAFRAPKSVSLAWGLAEDDDVAEQVREAHRAAVGATLGCLERKAEDAP